MDRDAQMRFEEVMKGLGNLGIDTACGACMGIFFTGVSMVEHTGEGCKTTAVEVQTDIPSTKLSDEKLKALAAALVKVAADLGHTHQEALDAMVMLVGKKFAAKSEAAMDVLMLLVKKGLAPIDAVFIITGLAVSITMTASTANRDDFLNTCREQWDNMVKASMQTVGDGG